MEQVVACALVTQRARVRSPVGTRFLGEVFSGFFLTCNGPGGASGKALRYGLDGPGSIPGVGGVEIFLHSFVSRLVLGSTQTSYKMSTGEFLRG